MSINELKQYIKFWDEKLKIAKTDDEKLFAMYNIQCYEEILKRLKKLNLADEMHEICL